MKNKRIAIALLEKGGVIDSRASDGYTLLILTVEAGHLEMTELLLLRRADPNTRNPRTRSYLHFTAILDHRDIIKLLLNHSTDINAQATKGASPLFLATQKNKLNVIEVLR